jgi:hypothetical protein
MAATQVDALKPPPRSTTTAAVQVDAPNPPPPLHVKVQADVPRNTANSAVQTTPLGTQYTSSQTLPHPGPIPGPTHITSLPPSPPLNWADDVALLPTLSPPIPSLPNLPSQPPLVDQPIVQASSPEKLSWADDVAASLPVFIPPTVSVPRDLSCLRSGKVHPFGALRQRDCRTHRQPRNPRKSRNRNTFIFSDPKSHFVPKNIPSHPYPISSISSFRTPTKLPKPPPLNVSPSHTSPSSRLDWESDPRLFALSTALKALGWNRGVS